MSNKKYTVKQAIYGAINNAENYAIDVTSKLQGLLDDKKTFIFVSNGTGTIDNGAVNAGFPDPCPGVVKAFSAVVEINNVDYYYASTEGGNIDFSSYPINYREDQLVLRKLSLTQKSGAPSPTENYIFSACSFTLENHTGSSFPPENRSNWVSIDFYFSTNKGSIITEDNKLGDVPCSVNMSEGSHQIVQINNAEELFNLTRLATTYPDLIPSSEPVFIYAQMRNGNGAIVNGSWSESSFIFS